MVKVFISYAHSSPARIQGIAQLTNVLRQAGLDVLVDADVKAPQGPAEGWPNWMNRRLDEADWVLIFFDEAYRRRFDGKEKPDLGLGAIWEGAVIKNELYQEASKNHRFIPLLADDASSRLIPRELSAWTFYRIPKQSQELARILVGNKDLDFSKKNISENTPVVNPISRGGEKGMGGNGPLRDVLIIPCCATKSNSGHEFHSGNNGIISALADKSLAEEVIRMRLKILGLIKGGALEGVEFKEGNRATRWQNRDLHFGPDFGFEGGLNEQRYLPGYRRYMGRCYQATAEEWERYFMRDQSLAPEPDILIVSGLYGLFPVRESIQNYDCHFTDLESKTGLTVRDHWERLLTDILVSRLELLERQGWQIGRVFDLMSENLYKTAFDWNKIYGRWNVMHQIFEKRGGREALDNVGIWLRSVIQQPEMLVRMEPDRFYSNPGFLHQDRCAFESRRFHSPLSVARDPA